MAKRGRKPMNIKVLEEMKEELPEYLNKKYQQKTEQITSIVYSDLMNGSQPSQIVAKLMNDEYGLGKKYCYDRAQKYLVMARRIMRDDVDKQRPFIKHQLVVAVMDILAKAKKKNDLNVALKAIDQVAKMTGCYDAQKLEIHQDLEINFGFENDNIITIEPEEITNDYESND